jgi:hypothetical protein
MKRLLVVIGGVVLLSMPVSAFRRTLASHSGQAAKSKPAVKSRRPCGIFIKRWESSNKHSVGGRPLSLLHHAPYGFVPGRSVG